MSNTDKNRSWQNLETLAIHAAADPDPTTGAIASPIHLSTTFEHGPENERLHSDYYIRASNPTQSMLEQTLALLEGGEDSLVFSSGMAAAAAMLQSLEPNSHVIFPEDTYFDVHSIHREFFPKWQLESTVVDILLPAAVEQAIKPNTKIIWIETPSNPKIDITDIRAISDIAQKAGAITVVDSTFATPMLQRPIELGADVVLHSTTKYCGGHSDVQGGCLVLKQRDPLYAPLKRIRTVLGAVCSPFNSWLVLRGLRTLHCRMDYHCRNAMAVAQALEKSPFVEAVLYPGLESHRGHETAKRQMRAFGGMLSILVKGGRKEAVAVAAKVRLFRNATSLGCVESLIEHRKSLEGIHSLTPENLLRLSIGLEHPDDLIADLLQALG